ncbi:MAG: DNA repair protein RecO [Syntrophales bacterium]|nr:DNA repair protein RecO [Syntrophales bacterium]
MNTRNTFKTPAIVLRCLDYGESDRIVTFYTSDFGKLKGIAKGARRSRRRFANNALEPFACSHTLFSRKGRDNLALIEDCDIINSYPDIRDDLEKMLLASYLVDLVDQFTRGGKENGNLFRLLQDFLTIIDAGDTSEWLVRFFEIRLLKLSGYEPVLDRCLTCKKPVSDVYTYRFNVKEGGLRCNTCCPSGFGSLPVSFGAIKMLLMGEEAWSEPGQINRLLLSGQSAEESRVLLVSFIQYLLGKELKSLRALGEIRSMGI